MRIIEKLKEKTDLDWDYEFNNILFHRDILEIKLTCKKNLTKKEKELLLQALNILGEIAREFN